MDDDGQFERPPEAVLIDRLERLLVATRDKMARGERLSRADMQRLNCALDSWCAPRSL